MQVITITQLNAVDGDITGKKHIVIGGQVGISQVGQAPGRCSGRAACLHTALHIEVGAGVLCQLHSIVAGVAGGVCGLDVAMAAVHIELPCLKAVSHRSDSQRTCGNSGIIGGVLNNNAVPGRIDGHITALLPEIVLADNTVGLTGDIQRTAVDGHCTIGSDAAIAVCAVTGGIDCTPGHRQTTGSQNCIACISGCGQSAVADGQDRSAGHTTGIGTGGRGCNTAGLGKFHITAGIDGIMTAATVHRQAAGTGELQSTGGLDGVAIGGGDFVGAGKIHDQVAICIDTSGAGVGSYSGIVERQSSVIIVEVASRWLGGCLSPCCRWQVIARIQNVAVNCDCVGSGSLCFGLQTGQKHQSQCQHQ